MIGAIALLVFGGAGAVSAAVILNAIWPAFHSHGPRS